MVVALLSNLRRIIGENSDLRPTVFKEHDAAATFGREDDPFANRPLIIRLFTFLAYDGIPWNNNNAEHAIKAFARLRNSASCYPLLLWTFAIYALRILPAH